PEAAFARMRGLQHRLPAFWRMRLRTEYDLGADAAVGVNFEQQRMPDAAVDHVRLANAGPQAVQARLHLGDHAGVDDAPRDQVAAAGVVEVAQQRRLVVTVLQDAGDVAQEHELLGLQVFGHGGGGGVGVDVQPAAVGPDGQRGDHRHDAGRAQVAD